MKTIAIISQKGGAGKTTVAVHLAVASVAAGQDTAIIDLDPQASSANWGDRRQADLPVVLTAFANRLSQEIERVQQLGGEMLFLDTAPHSDSVAVAAAKAADLIIIPCKPNILDIEAAASTIQLVKTTDTPHFVVLNGVAPAGGEANEAEAALREMYGVAVCPARLTNRIAFARSLTFGQVAQEFEPGGKAQEEVSRLYAHLSSIVDTSTMQQKNSSTDQQTNDRAVKEAQHVSAE